MIEPTLVLHTRNVEGHTCALHVDEDGIVKYINGGFWVDFRRKLKKFMMVSANNPESKSALKSTAQIRQEEAKHLNHYYYMIHPFSNFRTCWETAMIFVYAMLLFTIPLAICSKNTDHGILYFKLVLDIISMVDILLWFCTGYYDNDRQKIVMSSKSVACHYLKTWLVIDVLSTLPINFLMNIYNWHHYHYLKLVMMLKLFRITTMMLFVRKIFGRSERWSFSLKLINFAICYCTLLWWAANLIYCIRLENNSLLEASISKQLLKCAHEVVMKFTLIGVGADPTHTNLDVIFQTMCLLFGSIITMVILAQVMQIYSRHANSSDKYDNLIQQIGEYMKYKELPTRLREKVFQYVDFKFQKRVYKESDIFNNLSSNLRQEILLHNCKRLVEKVDFFKDLPTKLILRIVTKLKSETYLPNDIIVQAGIAGHAMYFIHMGTVAVYTSTGKEICHLHDGANFGEIALVINEPRVASVIAVKECELFRLSRKDFQEAIDPFPELSNKIRISALTRLENTMKLMDNRRPDDIE